jgi:tripartite-type tricarboxylate transporter receptor subunit TctC
MRVATARYSLAFLGLALLPLMAAPAPAQTYPARTITLVVAFPPGGATDVIARPVIDAMSQTLGQQIVIEYVGGAGGTLGAARVARAAPDGYTILIHQPGLPIGAALYPKLSFDVDKDFTGIGIVSNMATIMVGRGSLPANSLPELVRWMNEPGQSAKMAHAGIGSFGHVCGVMFVQEVGAKATQIPYRGGGPALNDVVAGHADLSCPSAAIAVELVKAGRLKGYGIFGNKRFGGLPEVPHFVEAGHKSLDLPFWQTLFAPVGTPRPAIDRLNAALRQALANPKVIEVFEKNGMDVYPAAQQTPEAATAMLKNEIKRWGDVVRANNIAAQ